MAGPTPSQNLHFFFKQLDPVFHRNAERPEISGLVPQANSKGDTALGYDIQSHHVLGQFDRVVQRQQYDRRAHPQLGRRSGYGGTNNQRRREEAVLVLMVFAEETRVEPSLLSQLCLFDNFVNTPGQILATRWIGDGTVDTKLHEITAFPKTNRGGKL